MARKYAECHIEINAGVAAKPGRRRHGAVNMEIMAGMAAETAPKPITLVIKGQNFHRVMELMNLFRQPDEAIVEAVRQTMPHELKGRTLDEVAAWVRRNVVTELEEME